MANRQVTAIKPFYDKVEKVNRSVGEKFEVSDERLAELNACGVEQGGEPLVKVVATRRRGARKAAQK